MVHLQLHIEDVPVELHDNEGMTITQSLQDVLDIQKIYTDYSRTFNVPASKVNNKIFQHFHNPEIDGYDARAKKSAKLFVNYKPFKEGFIRLESVQMHNNSPKNYRITFFGSLTTLNNRIKDNKLADLGEIAFSINYSPANVIAKLQEGSSILVDGEQMDEGLIYPLISAKDRWIYDSTSDVASSTNIHYGSNSKGIFFEHLKPAIRIHGIIKAIGLKYDLDFSTDFFNQTNLPYYNLYLWLNKQKGTLKNEDGTFPPTRNVSGWSSPVGLGDVGRGFYSSATGSYYAEYLNYGNYSGQRYLVVTTNADVGLEYNLKITHMNGDGVIFDQNETGTGDDQNLITLKDSVVLKKPYSPYDQFGSGYRFDVRSKQDGDVKLTVAVFTAKVYAPSTPLKEIMATADVTITTTSSYFTNVTAEMPDMKIMDFLTGIFKLFNLTATLSDGNQIKVQTLDSFYDDSNVTYDITNYMDKTESEVSAQLPYKNIVFEYKGKGSFFAAFHKEINQIGWGEMNHTTEFANTKGDYKISVPFEHHKFEKLFDVGTGASTSVQWGWSVNQDQESYVGMPLLFYGYKVTSGDAISVMETVGGTHHSISTYYIPSNSVDPTLSTSQTIHFGAEQNEYNAQQTLLTSLYKTYYKSYIESTFNTRRRLFRFKAYLPLSVIYNLKLNDKIIIFNTLYRINTMSTNFENNLTDFELINELQDFDVPATQVVKDLIKTSDSNIATIDNRNVTADNNKPIF